MTLREQDFRIKVMDEALYDAEVVLGEVRSKLQDARAHPMTHPARVTAVSAAEWHEHLVRLGCDALERTLTDRMLGVTDDELLALHREFEAHLRERMAQAAQAIALLCDMKEGDT